MKRSCSFDHSRSVTTIGGALGFAVVAVVVVAAIATAGCGSTQTEKDGGGEPKKAADASGSHEGNAKQGSGNLTAKPAADSTAAADGGAAAGGDSGGNQTPRGDANTTASAPSASALDDAVRTPATAAQAAAAIDLRKIPLPADVENPGLAIASVYFTTKAKDKEVFESIAKFFADNQWKLYHDVQEYPGSISAGYARDGFRVFVSVLSNSGQTLVSANNLGNVNLAKMPVPEGAKDWHSSGDVAAFLTDAGLEETRSAVHELLLADGWLPYGGAADTRDYKKNAVLLHARVLSPPTQPGKTAINYMSKQLSADLPAPPSATRVQYSDRPTEIRVDAPMTPEELAAYYRDALAAAAWKATTDNPIEDRYEQMLIFRNPGKDMLTLNMREIEEEKITRYSLEFQTAEEIAKLDAELKKQAEAQQKEREAEANKPRAKVAIAIPAGASDVEATDDKIAFKLASGAAKAAVDAIVRSLEADGWKAEVVVAEPMFGQIELKMTDASVSVSYVDPGIIPAEITISGSGVALERAQAKSE